MMQFRVICELTNWNESRMQYINLEHLAKPTDLVARMLYAWQAEDDLLPSKEVLQQVEASIL